MKQAAVITVVFKGIGWKWGHQPPQANHVAVNKAIHIHYKGGGDSVFFKKYGDIIVGIFFMAVSGTMIKLAHLLPKSKVMKIGPDFVPLLVGYITFMLAAALTILSIKNFKLRAAKAESEPVPQCDYARVIESVILMLIYVCYMQQIGFIVATLVFLFLQMFVLSPNDKRHPKDIVRLLIIDVIFVFAVFLLFRYGFKIVLPAGIFTINF